jgi:hypothetical protein
MDEALYKLNNGRATLRNPLDCSVLSHSLNRVYLVRATPSPKYLASLGTSGILKPLSEIAQSPLKLIKAFAKVRIKLCERR